MLGNAFRGEEESFHPKNNPGYRFFSLVPKTTICENKKKKSNHSLSCACHYEHTRTLSVSELPMFIALGTYYSTKGNTKQ